MKRTSITVSVMGTFPARGANDNSRPERLMPLQLAFLFFTGAPSMRWKAASACFASTEYEELERGGP